MSLINLAANIFTADYSSVHTIRSQIMAEAESRDGKFTGIIGVMEELKDDAMQIENIGQVSRGLGVEVGFRNHGNLPPIPVNSKAQVIAVSLG